MDIQAEVLASFINKSISSIEGLIEFIIYISNQFD